MMTVDELLTAIDTWRAAYEAHDAAVKESPGVTTFKRRIALRDLDNSSANVTGDVHFLGHYRVVITLADEIRRLQARITELETFPDPVVMLEHAQMKARIGAAAAIDAHPQESASDFETIIYNECRAEFRAALELE